jgi:hypothetical protein
MVRVTPSQTGGTESLQKAIRMRQS